MYSAPLRRLLALGRRQKRAVWIAVDLLLLGSTLSLLFALEPSADFASHSAGGRAIVVSVPLLTVALLFYLDLYRVVTRYIGREVLMRIAIGLVLSTAIWAVLFTLTQSAAVRLPLLLGYAVAGTLAVWGARQIAQLLIGLVPESSKSYALRRKILIFGVSETGVQLARGLERLGGFEIVGFSDDQRDLWGKYAAGHKIFRTDRLEAIVVKEQVREIFLAPRSNTRSERARIVHSLQHLPVAFRALPAMEDLALGNVSLGDLKFADAGDLLGRDPVPPVTALIRRSITDRSVMITGAGGSIGSELVRQSLQQGPAKLVLVELSEHALYNIHTEVLAFLNEQVSSGQRGNKPEIVAVLGSVLNQALMERTIVENGVQTIYHAAAHKHVPLVENNAIEGVNNNTFGTISVAEAAQRNNVEQFVFVSTDKAVRPTNVMGASKRCAELAVQSFAARQQGATVFSIVRFGNVIDSSGSVVRLFRKQIEVGGPLTVTDRDVVRYFMSIPEAASLVIQAGAMAKGGEVFVLDMGEPIRIEDLARSMVRLSGLTVRDETNPNGDIPIRYTGLRIGEKMHEELFLTEDTYPTEHPRIICAREPQIDPQALAAELTALRSALEQNLEGVLRARLFGIVGDASLAQRPAATAVQ